MVAGVGRALRALRHFRFDEETLRFLRDRDVVDAETADWLADYRFSGDIWGYPEGEVYFPGSPLVVVDGSFAECVLLETVLLSIYNHDSAIASAASRMTAMAGDRPCIEMGSRRTQELAAVAAARAAYIAGFAGDVQSRGRAALRGADDRAPPRTRSPCCTTTSETPSPPRSPRWARTPPCWSTPTTCSRRSGPGSELTEGRLGAVRLDSGDLGLLASQVRELLDSLGATKTKIIVTSDLDEFTIAALSGAPVDGYGVGTALVTGSGHPTCGFVYKLVARADIGRPRRRRWSRWPRRARTRSASVAASSPCAG